MIRAESLAAPIIGAVLRYRGKWQKCSDLAPIFAFLIKYMSMCMTTTESIQTLNMAKQVDTTEENRENRLCFLTCRGTP